MRENIAPVVTACINEQNTSVPDTSTICEPSQPVPRADAYDSAIVAALNHPSLYDIAEIFRCAPKHPILCRDGTSPTPEEKRAITRRFLCFGFVVVEFSLPLDVTRIPFFSGALALGAPVRPAYLKQRRDLRIEQAQLRASEKQLTFVTPADQSHPLHTDGICLPSDYAVRTTLLFCLSQGVSGGSIRLFHANAAFKELTEQQPKLAFELTQRAALRRKVTQTLADVGPAFYVLNGELRTRFALDNSAEWGKGRVAGKLQEAVSCMRELSVSPLYSCEVDLKPGQLLLIANDRICNGRTPYTESEQSLRRIAHVWFKSHPR